MAENSKIEWTDHTFNPWIGCQKVSPGCDHCYAESMSNRYGWTEWGPHGQRIRTSNANWKQPVKWNREAEAAGVRKRVFCASLADVFDNQAEEEWRLELWNLIALTPSLDWLLLTKRPENISSMLPRWWEKFGLADHVWLGTTCEDQERYNRRWPILAQIPAKVRFISYEPALERLRIGETFQPDWIICGGESGPGARHMHPDWARDVRDDCAKLGVAFFMKQMTGKKPIPDDLMVRQFPKA